LIEIVLAMLQFKFLINTQKSHEKTKAHTIYNVVCIHVYIRVEERELSILFSKLIKHN